MATYNTPETNTAQYLHEQKENQKRKEKKHNQVNPATTRGESEII